MIKRENGFGLVGCIIVMLFATVIAMLVSMHLDERKQEQSASAQLALNSGIIHRQA